MKSMIACIGLLFASVAYAEVDPASLYGTWQSPCRAVETGSYQNLLTMSESGVELRQETFATPGCAPEATQGVESASFTYTLSPSAMAEASNLDIVNVADPEDKGYTIIGRRDDRLCFGIPTEELDGAAPERRPDRLSEYDNCYSQVTE
jgi:hypothetical protein